MQRVTPPSSREKQFFWHANVFARLRTCVSLNRTLRATGGLQNLYCQRLVFLKVSVALLVLRLNKKRVLEIFEMVDKYFLSQVLHDKGTLCENLLQSRQGQLLALHICTECKLDHTVSYLTFAVWQCLQREIALATKYWTLNSPLCQSHFQHSSILLAFLVLTLRRGPGLVILVD